MTKPAVFHEPRKTKSLEPVIQGKPVTRQKTRTQINPPNPPTQQGRRHPAQRSTPEEGRRDFIERVQKHDVRVRPAETFSNRLRALSAKSAPGFFPHGQNRD